MVLPRISGKLLSDIYQEITRFLWDGKKAKISLRTLQSNKKSGGANLVDIRSRETALKLTWIQILREDGKMSKLVYSFMPRNLNENVWRCNFSSQHVDFICPKTRSKFWNEILDAWASINFNDNATSYHGQMLWFNSLILCGNQTPMEQKCIR